MGLVLFFAAVTLILLGVTVRIIWRLFALGIITTKKQPEREFWNMPIEPLIQVEKPEVVKIRTQEFVYTSNQEAMRYNVGGMFLPEDKKEEMIKREAARAIAEEIFRIDALETVEHGVVNGFREDPLFERKSFQIEVVRPIER